MRAGYYYIVDCAIPIPFNVALDFNEKWGQVVRVDGYAGGKEVTCEVDHYHIDTSGGLLAFKQLVYQLYGEEKAYTK